MKCPKCEGYNTKEQCINGSSFCHSCGYTWPEEDEAEVSGKLGPDWRALCVKAAAIIKQDTERINGDWGDDTAEENADWLKEYEEAIK